VKHSFFYWAGVAEVAGNRDRIVSGHFVGEVFGENISGEVWQGDLSAGKVDAVTKFLVLPLSVVGHRVRVTKKRGIMDDENPVTPDTLAALIIEYWECAMSDSGLVWDKARRALDKALVGVEDGVKRDAYALAYRMTLNRGK